uniref:Uncharacterized protein n=2 Tax=Oryza glumipatula TaxID=40148 RepID=A0A0D9ZS75_9ORYZ
MADVEGARLFRGLRAAEAPRPLPGPCPRAAVTKATHLRAAQPPTHAHSIPHSSRGSRPLRRRRSHRSTRRHGHTRTGHGRGGGAAAAAGLPPARRGVPGGLHQGHARPRRAPRRQPRRPHHQGGRRRQPQLRLHRPLRRRLRRHQAGAAVHPLRGGFVADDEGARLLRGLRAAEAPRPLPGPCPRGLPLRPGH